MAEPSTMTRPVGYKAGWRAGAAILAWARPLTGLLSAGFNIVTIAVESLIIESLAAIVLGTWTVIAAAAVARRS